MAKLSKRFPPGLKYDIVYNPTQFIQQSVDAVIDTIFEAIVLVVLVVILFLQTWRAAIIPLVAIPVSLIGTFFFMAAFGFTLNNLSLVRPGAGDRHRGRRRHRRGRERRAQHRRRAGAARGGAQEHGRGRLGADRDCAGAVRGVRAVGVHHRHFRAVLSPVRADHRRRHGHFADRVADAVAGDVRALAQAARPEPSRHLVGAADPRLFRLFQCRVRPRRLGHFLARHAHGAARRDDGRDLSGRARASAFPRSARRRSASSRRSTAATSSSWCNCRRARRCRAPTRCSSARSISRSACPASRMP